MAASVAQKKIQFQNKPFLDPHFSLTPTQSNEYFKAFMLHTDKIMFRKEIMSFALKFPLSHFE